MKKPQVPLDHDVHASLKKYCAIKGKKLSHIASQILRAFLETKHEEIESEGKMIIEGEEEKPKTIVAVLEEDQEEKEPRNSLKGIEIVKKGNRYVVKKRKAKQQN